MRCFKRCLPAGTPLRRPVVPLLACFTLLVLSAGAALHPAPAFAQDTGARKIELSTHAIPWNPDDRADMKADKLEWAGEIQIGSDDKSFGGWSGLAVSTDGSTLLAVSDEGQWLTAQLLYDERGRLSGMGEAEIAPMLGLKGKPLTRKELADAEGLAVDDGDPLSSNAYVSFERAHRVWRYNLGKDGFAATPDQIVTERRLGRLNSNSGLEALTIMKPAEQGKPPRLFLVTEDTRDPRGNVRAFITEGHSVKRLSVRLHAPYRPTDIARLPDGDFLLLERRYSLMAGAGMQIRRIRKDDVKPDAIVDGDILLDVGQKRSIDNMEGMSVRQDQKGNVWIYVISDDNKNPLQRTLLVMFRLKTETIMPHHTLDEAVSPAEAAASGSTGRAPRAAE